MEKEKSHVYFYGKTKTKRDYLKQNGVRYENR